MADQLATVVCRCEDLRDEDLHAALQRFAIASLEDLKRHTRATMGPCQGRVCRTWLTQYWDRAVRTGQAQPPTAHAPNSVADLPWGTGTVPGHRPPVRPVRVADIAAIELDENAPWGDKEAP